MKALWTMVARKAKLASATVVALFVALALLGGAAFVSDSYVASGGAAAEGLGAPCPCP